MKWIRPRRICPASVSPTKNDSPSPLLSPPVGLWYNVLSRSEMMIAWSAAAHAPAAPTIIAQSSILSVMDSPSSPTNGTIRRTHRRANPPAGPITGSPRPSVKFTAKPRESHPKFAWHWSDAGPRDLGDGGIRASDQWHRTEDAPEE